MRQPTALTGSAWVLAGVFSVGGNFTTLAGQPRRNIGRLNADGTLDTTFNPGVNDAFNIPNVASVSVQANGKILVGGSFTTIAGQSRFNIGRLNALLTNNSQNYLDSSAGSATQRFYRARLNQ
ncbi:MAG: hypothetical protein DME18_08180 [Verrucomicrobia bacterium]|nr:MAG: hypothetical protein DME18_08180 [Verrucomicrobiota bacterium]